MCTELRCLPSMPEVLVASQFPVHINRAWCCTPIILALRLWRQEHPKLKAVLCSAAILRPTWVHETLPLNSPNKVKKVASQLC